MLRQCTSRSGVALLAVLLECPFVWCQYGEQPVDLDGAPMDQQPTPMDAPSMPEALPPTVDNAAEALPPAAANAADDFEEAAAVRRAQKQHAVMAQFMHNFARNMRYAVLADSKGDMPESERQRLMRQAESEGAGGGGTDLGGGGDGGSFEAPQPSGGSMFGAGGTSGGSMFGAGGIGGGDMDSGAGEGAFPPTQPRFEEAPLQPRHAPHVQMLNALRSHRSSHHHRHHHHHGRQGLRMLNARPAWRTSAPAPEEPEVQEPPRRPLVQRPSRGEVVRDSLGRAMPLLFSGEPTTLVRGSAGRSAVPHLLSAVAAVLTCTWLTLSHAF